jgi:glucokinase
MPESAVLAHHDAALPGLSTTTGLPRPWLVADIGGTNARFGWLADGADTLSHIATLPAAGHPGPADAAAHYLAGLAQSLGSAYRPPRAAAFAVATAVGDDRIVFTNSDWAFSRREAQHSLGLDELLVLNDFEALALSLPRLLPAQVRAWPGSAAPRSANSPGAAARSALAVIGPGTGLGVAGLVPAADGRWVAVPGEGGHATLAAADDFDAALLAAVWREHPHVSAERLLSGIGLPVLHAAVAAVLGQAAAPRAAPAPLSTELIVERGLNGQCPVCSRTLDAFCALLGSFAGNVALVLGARGGVYIGGGIVPRLGERFFLSPFRQRFEAKGRFQPYLQAIPTLLITDTLAALNGGVQALAQHRR